MDMDIGSLCTRRLITIGRSASLQQAAALMREHHVGSLVVTEAQDEGERVCGLVTDRDLAIEVLARGFDGARSQVGQMLDGRLVVAPMQASVADAIELMQNHGVRRLLVRDDIGNLVGLVSFDDLLQACADQFNALAQVVRKGIERETVERQALAAPPRPPLLRVPSSGTAGWANPDTTGWVAPAA
jgi:CBS-domain-containing membrane protein